MALSPCPEFLPTKTLKILKISKKQPGRTLIPIATLNSKNFKNFFEKIRLKNQTTEYGLVRLYGGYTKAKACVGNYTNFNIILFKMLRKI